MKKAVPGAAILAADVIKIFNIKRNEVNKIGGNLSDDAAVLKYKK